MIVIAGLGQVGRHLLKVLASRKLSAIDIRGDALPDTAADVSFVEGNAGNTEVLLKAGADKSEIYIALTSSGEVNIVSSFKAKKLGTKKVIARLDETEYFDDPKGLYPGFLGIDMVMNSKFLLAQEIYKVIKTRGVVSVEEFAENEVEMVHIHISARSEITNKPLKNAPLPDDVLIVMIKRNGKIIVPSGEDSITQGDEIIAIGKIESVEKLEESLVKERKTKSVVILGGGTMGFIVSSLIEREGAEITLIEFSRAQCEILSRELAKTTVLCGDGTDINLLRGAGVPSADVFVAVTGEDERNIITGRLAKEMGVKRSIVLVDRSDYYDVCGHLGLETIMSPRIVMAKEILRFIGEPKITSPVMGGEAEFAEITITEKSRVAWRRLIDVNLPKGAIVCAILSREGVIIPKGETILKPGDKAVVFYLSGIGNAVGKIF